MHHILKYRPDIDGLRAIAVLSVVIFHYFPSYVPGGFIGVDIFLVISGFLITSILLKEINEGSFSFFKFYQRRIKRIFPSLITVFIVFLIFGWGVLFQSEFKNLGKHILGGMFFVSNLILRKEINYFDIAAELKPFLNLWSLAIEEQFYIVWPLTLLFLTKRFANIKLIFLGFVCCSFLYNLIGCFKFPEKFFYSPWVRAWQLGAGALLCFYLPRGLSSAALNFLSFLGMILIVVGFIFLNDKIIYPGVWALLPTLGTACFIGGGGSSFLNRYIFSQKLFVGIGLISYPLYLWHWPLLSFSRIIDPSGTTNTRKIILAISSIILSYLTYRFIEKPLRFGSNSNKKIKWVLGISALLTVISALIYKGYISAYNLEDPKIYQDDWDDRSDAIPVKFKDRNLQYYRGGAQDTVIFVGDSHIEQYAPRIKKIIKDKSFPTLSAIFMTSGGCPFLPHVGEKFHPNCVGLVENATEFIEKNPFIKRVVIGFAQDYEASELYVYDSGRENLSLNKGGFEKAIQDLIELINFYQEKLKKEVILFLDIPSDGLFDPIHHIERRNFFTRWKKEKEISKNKKNVLKSTMLQNQKTFRNALEKVASETGATLIDPLPYLCKKDICPIFYKGKFIYKDGGHLAASYAKNNVVFVDELMRKK